MNKNIEKKLSNNWIETIRNYKTVLFMIQNYISDYLLKHLMHMQQIMMLSTNSSEDAGFRSITRKFS